MDLGEQLVIAGAVLNLAVYGILLTCRFTDFFKHEESERELFTYVLATFCVVLLSLVVREWIAAAVWAAANVGAYLGMLAVRKKKQKASQPEAPPEI